MLAADRRGRDLLPLPEEVTPAAGGGHARGGLHEEVTPAAGYAAAVYMRRSRPRL